MSFPIEVVDRILGFLEPDTLEICAQSHPTLLTLSERYTYADIVLLDDLFPSTRAWRDFRTSDFIQILTNNSNISNHIRSLIVICVPGNLGSGQHEATSSHLDGVASLLPMFTGLTRLTIWGHSGGYFAWHTMPKSFCQAFLHCLQVCPRVITHIMIHHIHFFPMSLLDKCQNLVITLRGCEEVQYDTKSTNPKDLSSNAFPCRHLSISSCHETCVENIATWLKMHGLRSLSYGAYGQSDFLQQLLVACSNTLTHLHLDSIKCLNTYQISNNSAVHSGDIARLTYTLADLRHLTEITIDTHSKLAISDETEGSWTLHSPIPAIAELIGTACPTLKQITIKITFSITAGLHFEQPPDSFVIWSPFIPLAAQLPSAFTVMYISPSFLINYPFKYFRPAFFSPLADYKGLTPYVQRGVVVISEDYLKK